MWLILLCLSFDLFHGLENFAWYLWLTSFIYDLSTFNSNQRRGVGSAAVYLANLH